ncbi:hypothetical protein D3C80_2002230 [compost metagenome]
MLSVIQRHFGIFVVRIKMCTYNHQLNVRIVHHCSQLICIQYTGNLVPLGFMRIAGIYGFYLQVIPVQGKRQMIAVGAFSVADVADG